MSAPQPEAGQRPGADVILIGCVRTNNAAASTASRLFTSPLFEGRLRHALASGLPWYILSAKFGLLAPDDVIGPDDMFLASQSPGYKKAWGEFVTVQLEQREHVLRGRRIEVHASAAYVGSLRAPLAACGAILTVPLAHLRQGEQIAWYHTSDGTAGSPVHTPSPAASGVGAADLARLLSDPLRALSPQELLGRGHQGLLGPGLYSWWVDDRGAADLSRGLGRPVPGGLIYAGQVGTARRPGGKRSYYTPRGPMTGMLLGATEFSTFLRTLAAILRPVLDLSSDGDPQLSAWISTHLGVNGVSIPDPDRLAETEAAVLGLLDPPLNLRGRPPSPIRARLVELRHGPAQSDSDRDGS